MMKLSISPSGRISRRWRHAILYGVLYLVTLFGFAYIYWRLPGENFYHANVSREPMLREDKGRISRELREEILNTFQNINGGNQKLIGSRIVDASTFEVLFLEPTDKGNDVEISFTLDMKITTSNKGRKLYYDPIITFSALRGGAESVSGSDENPTVRKTASVNMPSVPDWDKTEYRLFVEAFFPTQPTREIPDKEDAGLESGSLFEVTMPIAKSLNEEIMNLAKGVQGDPSNLEGHFERMLHLSAVTITTVGYGDISPLTTPARILVSVEAVLGIVIIGFFVAGPQKKSKDSPAASQLSPEPSGDEKK